MLKHSGSIKWVKGKGMFPPLRSRQTAAGKRYTVHGSALPACGRQAAPEPK